MITIIKQITAPYFETRLGRWIFRGFIFQNDNIEFLFLQEFDVFGSHTDWVEIQQHWKLYKTSENTKLISMTGNGISTDAGFLKGDSSDSISRRNGLTVEDIINLETHAKEQSLLKSQINDTVITEIQPLLTKQVLIIEDAMVKLPNLGIIELVSTIKELQDLSTKIKAMYPRSYEILQKNLLRLREAYAKTKYPDLYAEIKKMHEDQKYMVDEDDTIAGFGIRSMQEGLFYQYFIKSESIWENRSPFEGQFKKPVLLKE